VCGDAEDTGEVEVRECGCGVAGPMIAAGATSELAAA
jgi:hypothetical protein